MGQRSKKRENAKLRRKHGFKRRLKLRNDASKWKKKKSSRGFGQRSRLRGKSKPQRRKRAYGPKSKLRKSANRWRKKNAPGARPSWKLRKRDNSWKKLIRSSLTVKSIKGEVPSP